MRRASQVLFKIGKIISIFELVAYLICVVVFFILGGSVALIQQGLEDGSITTDIQGNPEEVAIALAAVFIALAVVFLFLGAFVIVNVVLTSKALKNPTKGICIANIVFGIISGAEVNAVGGFLGVFAKE